MQVYTMACGKTARIASGSPSTIDDSEQQVLDVAIAQFVHHPQPELRALVLLQPEAEDLLGAVGAHAQRDVHGLVPDDAFVADLDPQRVEEHQRIDGLERPRLPGGDLVQHRVGDGADEVGRHHEAVELAHMADDLAGTHAARVHRHHLVVEAGEAALILGDQLRIERRLPVPRISSSIRPVSVVTVLRP